MSPTNRDLTRRYYDALRTIGRDFASPEQLRRTPEAETLGYRETLEMAYENVLIIARRAIGRRRRP